MEIENPTDSEGVLSKQVEVLNKRVEMKYFCKVSQSQSLLTQRVKRQGFSKLSLKNREDLKNVFPLLRTQRSALKTLQNIEINRQKDLSLSQIVPFIKHIRNNIYRFRQLKFHFPLEFREQEILLIKGIGNQNKQFKQLILDFGQCRMLESTGMTALETQIIKSRGNPLQLSLNFVECPDLKHRVMSALTTSLGRSLQNLRQLQLTWNANLWQEGIKDLTVYFGKNLNQLKQLNLSLTNISVTDKTIIELASQLQNLKNLGQLILNSRRCPELTNKGFQALSSCLKNSLHELRHLSLTFYLCFPTDKGVEDLALAIGKGLKQLQILHLNFHDFPSLTDKGIIALATHLKNNETLLQLTLLFFESQDFTDLSVQTLAEVIRDKLLRLQHLHISFDACPQITGKSVKALSESIGTLQNLQHLSLDFRKCPYVTGEAIIALGNFNSKNLSHLTLNFSNCLKITDQAIEALASTLGNNLHQLRELQLYFSNCLMLTDNGILALASQLERSLQKLRKLALDFSGISNFTNEAMNSLVVQGENRLKRLDSLFLRHSKNGIKKF